MKKLKKKLNKLKKLKNRPAGLVGSVPMGPAVAVGTVATGPVGTVPTGPAGAVGTVPAWADKTGLYSKVACSCTRSKLSGAPPLANLSESLRGVLETKREHGDEKHPKHMCVYTYIW